MLVTHGRVGRLLCRLGLKHHRVTEESMSLSGPQASSFALRGSCGLILVGNYGGMVHVYGVIYNRTLKAFPL